MSQSIADRLKEADADVKKAENFVPFGQFAEGQNKLVIDTTAGVSTEKGKFGIQHIYIADLNGERVKIGLPKSVEMLVLSGLKKNKNSFVVTKTGKGMETRYKVK